MTKTTSLMAIALLALLGLTGCSDINGDLEKESAVNRRVASEVPSEKYELVSVEHHEDERPKKDVYTYKSRERDLTFEAVSTLQAIGIDGSTLGYNKAVYVKYVNAVQAQYTPQVNEILSKYRIEKGQLVYSSFDELSEIAADIARINDIYKAELAYNSQEWLSEHPLTYRFEHEREDYPGFYQGVFGESVDGTLDYDSVYQYITYRHAEAVKNGKFTDDTTPAQQLARIHKEELVNIYYEFDNISRTAYEDARAARLNNNLESAYYAYYYYPWDSYVITLDCGLTDEKYAPKCMEAYGKTFGFSPEVQYSKGEITWKYNGARWKIQAAKDSDSNVTSFCIYKNGKDLEVPYITSRDKISPIGASYVVGISVESFAEIFGLQYEINEDANSITFR